MKKIIIIATALLSFNAFSLDLSLSQDSVKSFISISKNIEESRIFVNFVNTNVLRAAYPNDTFSKCGQLDLPELKTFVVTIDGEEPNFAIYGGTSNANILDCGVSLIQTPQ